MLHTYSLAWRQAVCVDGESQNVSPTINRYLKNTVCSRSLRIARTSNELANPTKSNLALLLLGAFAKIPEKRPLRAFLHSRLCVRPSVSVELGSHWMDFHEILYLSIFIAISRENPSFIKSD